MNKTFLIALSASALTIGTTAFADSTESSSSDPTEQECTQCLKEKQAAKEHAKKAAAEKRAETEKRAKECEAKEKECQQKLSAQMTKSHEGETTVTTGKAQELPPSDIAERAPRKERNYVENPTGISVGGTLGYGTSDAFRVGVGGRLGYTFPGRIYVGAMGDYQFGSTTSVLNASTKKSTWYIGPEAGYDLGVGQFIVRPVVGLGLGFLNSKATFAGETTASSDAKFFVSPGAEIMYPIGNAFIGADARYLYMRDASALILFANGGVHL